MNRIDERIGQRIKEIRRAEGLTQEALAEKVEISTRYLSRLEVGKQSGSVETLTRLAEVLEVELWELFDFGHHATPQQLRNMLRKLIQGFSEQQLRLALRLMQVVMR